MLHKLLLFLILLVSATTATAQRYSEYELRELASLPTEERDSLSNAWFNRRRQLLIYGNVRYPAIGHDLDFEGMVRVAYTVDSLTSVRILDTVWTTEIDDVELDPSTNHIEVIGYKSSCCYPNGCNTFIGLEPVPWCERKKLAKQSMVREVARIAKLLGPVQALAGESMPAEQVLYFEFRMK